MYYKNILTDLVSELNYSGNQKEIVRLSFEIYSRIMKDFNVCDAEMIGFIEKMILDLRIYETYTLINYVKSEICVLANDLAKIIYAGNRVYEKQLAEKEHEKRKREEIKNRKIRAREKKISEAKELVEKKIEEEKKEEVPTKTPWMKWREKKQKVSWFKSREDAIKSLTKDVKCFSEKPKIYAKSNTKAKSEVYNNIKNKGEQITRDNALYIIKHYLKYFSKIYNTKYSDHHGLAQFIFIMFNFEQDARCKEIAREIMSILSSDSELCKYADRVKIVDDDENITYEGNITVEDLNYIYCKGKGATCYVPSEINDELDRICDRAFFEECKSLYTDVMY